MLAEQYSLARWPVAAKMLLSDWWKLPSDELTKKWIGVVILRKYALWHCAILGFPSVSGLSVCLMGIPVFHWRRGLYEDHTRHKAKQCHLQWTNTPTTKQVIHGREPDGVTSYYPIPQDGGANRTKVGQSIFPFWKRFSALCGLY